MSILQLADDLQLAEPPKEAATLIREIKRALNDFKLTGDNRSVGFDYCGFRCNVSISKVTPKPDSVWKMKISARGRSLGEFFSIESVKRAIAEELAFLRSQPPRRY